MPATASAIQQRSAIEWCVRACLAGMVAVVGYFAVTYSFAEALADNRAAVAYRLAPHNARVAAQFARASLLADPSLRNRAEEARVARVAIRRDATAVAAVSTLGFIEEANGNSAAANRLFRYSDRLSRRDLITRLWLIENAVRRDQIDEALRHYDIALRTSRAAPGILLPVLASASAEPPIAAALVKMLAKQPAWTNDFLWAASGTSGNPAATAGLFTALSRAGVAITPAARANLILKLVEAKLYSAAWQYYASVRPNSQPDRSRDANFTGSFERPTAFDWNTVPADEGISATIDRAGDHGQFDFSVPSGLGGEMLNQLQVLPPGSYVLEGHSLDLNQPKGSAPYWTLRCARDGREIARIDVPNSDQDRGRFSGQFTVPANCPAQQLVFVARASDVAGGVTGQIDRLQILPAQ